MRFLHGLKRCYFDVHQEFGEQIRRRGPSEELAVHGVQVVIRIFENRGDRLKLVLPCVA
jgi:hypothetical protein